MPDRHASSARSSTPEFAALYHELEHGTDAIAYVNPYLPHRASARATRPRRRWSTLVQAIIRPPRDAAAGRASEDRDLLDVLLSLTNAGRHAALQRRR